MRKLAPLNGPFPSEHESGLLFSPVSGDLGGGLDLMNQARRFIQQQPAAAESLNIQPLAAAEMPMQATVATPLVFGLPAFNVPTIQYSGSGSLSASGSWSGETFAASGGNTGVKLYGEASYSAALLHGSGFNFTLFQASGPVTGNLSADVPLQFEFTLTDTGTIDTQVNLWTLTITLGLANGLTESLSTQGIGLGTFSNLMPTFIRGSANAEAITSYSVTLMANIDDVNNGGAADFTLTVPHNSIDLLIPQPPNNPPVAVDDAFSTNEDRVLFGNLLAANPTTADSDADRDPLTVTQINGLPLGGPMPLGRGIIILTTDGNHNFNPNGGYETLRAGEQAIETFTYTIDDGRGGTDTATATITILGVNDAPVAQDDRAQTAKNTAVNIPVLANDSDIDGDRLSVLAAGPASNGTVTIRADEVSVRYTPNAGFSGFDTFSYTVSDGSGSMGPTASAANTGSTAWATVTVLVASHSGTSGNDVLLTTQQADFILAGDGNDRILAYGGADYIDGGRGADTLSGGLGADTLLGGDGADTFLTTAAELDGDSIDGGNATDTLQITDPIAVMPANFTLVNVEQLSFPGSLQVGHTSLLDLSALTLTGTGNQISGGTAATRIIGTRSNDRITDSAGNDDLRGGDGNDTIMAGVGQDTVYGGNGNDTLGGSSSTLGDGSVDTFVFNTALNALTNVDTLLAFEANSRDLIALDSGIFAAIGVTLDAGEFRAVAGGVAVDANDFIVYDTATGALYYDADGSGAGARTWFATLGGGLTGTVDASDFTVGSFRVERWRPPASGAGGPPSSAQVPQPEHLAMNTFHILTGSANPFDGFSVSSTSAPRLTDLDGDGDLDLMVGSRAGTVSYWQNTGTADDPLYLALTGAANPFQGVAVVLQDELGFRDIAPVLADLNADGKPEAVIGAADGTLLLYQNPGPRTAPAFALATTNPFLGIDVHLYATPFLADLDGDRDLDLVVGNNRGELAYFRNTGTPAAPVFVAQTGTDNPFNAVNAAENYSFAAPSLVDLDGDGDLDAVIGINTGQLLYAENTGSAVAPAFVLRNGSANPLGSLTVNKYAASTFGDFDGDGDPDLLIGESTGALTAVLNNSAPVAVNDAFTTGEDAELIEDVIYPIHGGAPDEDPEGLVLVGITQVNGSAGNVGTPITLGQGALTVDFDGAFSFDPRGGYDALPQGGSATETFTYTVRDDRGATDDATVTITITGVNDAPTLNTVAIVVSGTDEDTASAAITVASLLGSAGLYDVDGGSSTGIAVTGSTGSGHWEYIAHEHKSSDASAGKGDNRIWTTLGSTNEAKALLLDGDALLRYVPNGRNGETAHLSFRAWDQTTDSASTDSTRGTGDARHNGGSSAYSASGSTASLQVISINDAPSLSTLAFALPVTDEDTTTAGLTVASLLASARWADVDTGALQGLAITATFGNGQWQYSTGGASWTPIGETSASAAVLLADGSSVRYVPDGRNGETAGFSFRAWDRTSGSASTAGSVSTADTSGFGGTSAFSSEISNPSLLVTSVNDAPTTAPVVLLPAMPEDGSPLTISQTQLLANAADVDRPAQTLTVTDVQISAGLGSVVSTGPGTWLYVPAPNDDTQVSFSYTIGDGSATVAGSAKLDLLPVNDPPVAVADSAQAASVGGAVNIAVLANDSDIDGGPLTVAAVTQGGGGSVAIRADGVSVRYTPNAGFSGFDTFTYTASDGAGGTAVGTVRVLVPSYIGTAGNDVPLGTPQADFMQTGDGNDRVLSYEGADYIDGGRGADTLSGGLGADTLLGGDGADTFLTTAAELAGDSIDGGNQIDTLQITDPIAVMPAVFTLVNVEQLSFPGSLQVGHTALLDLSALTLSGTGNQINGGTAASRITGSRSADRITDSAGNDDLRGGDGNDTIMAGVGQDTVYGGNGNDTLGGSSSTLGDGSVDTFVFNTALNGLTNVDTVIGFEAGSRDVIALDSGIFSAIGPTLDASEFRSAVGGNAADGNDFILFDPATGALYYDADGSGAVARIQFATLGAGLTGTVDATDFVVGPYPA